MFPRSSKSILTYVLVLLCFLVLSLQSCKSKKESKESIKEKNYSFGQSFSSRYNILFNAKAILAEEEENLSNVPVNFSVRQRVFNEPSALGNTHQLMDSLIHKAYKIINEKQESRYIGEAYFLIGKAHYLKGSYHEAIEFFNNLLRLPDVTLDDRSLAFVWKSRALLQMGKGEDALRFVDSATNYLEDITKAKPYVHAARANYLILNNQFVQAIPSLEQAVAFVQDNTLKRKWIFLLGQLYRENNQLLEAKAAFRKIAASNVPYDMAFEAELQYAYLKALDDDFLEKKAIPLRKMLRDSKNKDYRDQILFQLGILHMTGRDSVNGLSFLKKSLQTDQKNSYQTTKTYLTLGDYFFTRKDYSLAQSYYDSAAVVLPVDYTDVDLVRRKLGYMSQLTPLLGLIVKNDTLLYLSTLSEDKLEITLADYAQQRLVNKRNAMQAGMLTSKKLRTSVNFDPTVYTRPLDVANADRTFYFNNADERQLGESIFRRRWGDRQLQDGWRYRADNIGGLTSTSVSVDGGPQAGQELFDEVSFLEEVQEGYRRVIPYLPAEQIMIHRNTQENLIQIGNIYRAYAQDNKEAVRAYEEFLRRYRDQATSDIYYTLYLLYMDIDLAQSAAYKQQLVSLFPNSVHAKVTLDPDYLRKYHGEKSILNQLFSELYDDYFNGKYEEFLKEYEVVKNKFEGTNLMVQLQYLKALTVGKTMPLENFKQELVDIQLRYPSDSLVTPIVRDHLLLMEEYASVFSGREVALEFIESQVIESQATFAASSTTTRWPALVITGDYRSSVPLPEKVLKKEEKVSKVIVKQNIPLDLEEHTKSLDSLQGISGVNLSELTSLSSLSSAGGQIGRVNLELAEEHVNSLENMQGSARGVNLSELTLHSSLSATGGEIGRMNLELSEEHANSLENMQGSVRGVNLSALTSHSSLSAVGGQVGRVNLQRIEGSVHEKAMLPADGTYYFVINVADARINLASSRYGIGQFNRSRYSNTGISHQLKLVNEENQLVYIGPFSNLQAVKAYEARILPMMTEIMKVPLEIYNTFVIGTEGLPGLIDREKINSYQKYYGEL